MKSKIPPALALLAIGIGFAHAQGTAFTYQGRLGDAGGLANGLYDFQFAVRDGLTGGNTVGSIPVNSTVPVTNGLFTVTLDPGPGVFTGAARWLEISVRTNGAGLFTLLGPRRELTAAPYALAARTVTDPLTASQIPALDASKITSGTLATGQIPSLDASKIGAGTLADARLSANVLMTNGNPTFSGTVTVTGTLYGSPPYLNFAEAKAKGVDGGANVAGINIRTFSAKRADTHNLGSQTSGGDIVLPAGTYYCRISAPGYRVNSHQLRLSAVTNGVQYVLLYGTSEYSDIGLNPGVQSRSQIDGQFVLTATSSTLRVEHYMEMVKTVNGLGVTAAASWTDGSPVELYSVAEIWKLR